ncbi:FAD-dependent monooxygenase [Hahella ganghwensis]|uniref:FAD-dependent monooxygenase n=1 Tax=Hahella ganghwensis TaxID=286420 RepID=UPI000363B332|nr:FAD-dependent monooxygenase [Hahella ganghwensis]
MNIAILGAGVAGISTAIALKQNGFNVSIYERHKTASNIGAGVLVWPNAACILEQIGVLKEIEAASGKPTRMQRLSHLGENLGAINIELLNSHMGYPSFSILRRDLQKVLMDKLGTLGVSIQFGHAVTSIKTNEEDKTVVYFQNGLSITPDVVIGADGRMTSHARQYVCKNNQPVYQGFINWVGVFESTRDTFEESIVKDYWGIGKRFGVVPVSRTKAYWAGGMASKKSNSRTPGDYKTELNAAFSEWPELVTKVIESTQTENINKIYVHDHDPARIWHQNTLIMIGDAAHAPLPTSGQGACQALEDSWHLTNCLIKYRHDLTSAFEAFTSLRFDKTTNIIVAARQFASSLFHQDEAFCMARNQESKNTDFTKAAEGMARFWGTNLPCPPQATTGK